MLHLPVTVLDLLWRVVLVGVVLVGALATLVVLLVHMLGVSLGLVFGLLAVEEVLALGLGKLVDLRTSKAGDEFLGEGVGDGLA